MIGENRKIELSRGTSVPKVRMPQIPILNKSLKTKRYMAKKNRNRPPFIF